MTCPECDEPVVRFRVPDGLEGTAPDGAAATAICTSCLSLQPADAPDEAPNYEAVSEHLPDDAPAATSLALGLLDSVAVRRGELETLLDHVERAGVDFALVVDRIAEDRSLDPDYDVRRRHDQLEQLLD